MLSSARSRISLGVATLLVVVTFALYVLLNQGTAGATATATLTVFTGTAQLQHSGGSFANAASGTTVAGGDTVRTGANSKAALNFADGSITRLDSGTTLTVVLANKNGTDYHTSLLQQAGKTWNNVSRLLGASSFTVTGPNSSTAEVRGTKFAFIIDSGGVRTDDFQGVIDFSGAGKTQHLATGQFSNIPPGQAPTPPAPIPPADLNDQFTIFNVAADANHETAGGNVTGVSANNVISVGQTTPVQPGGTADGNTDLNFTLDWAGSTFELILVDPDGNDFQSQTSAGHPFTLTLAKPRAGQWSYKVHDVQSEKPSEQWSVVVSAVTPSKLTPQPFFVGADATACDHTVTAGSTSTWTVAAHSPAGPPLLTVPTLPSYASTSGGTGSLTFTWSPPATLAESADLGFSITAALAGGVATLNCTEHVRALPRASVISGHVHTHDGTAIAGIAIQLTRPDGTTAGATSDADGAYSFGGLGAGVYTVTVTLPSGYTADAPSPSTATISVDGTNAVIQDFSLNPPPAAPAPTPAPSAGNYDCQTRAPASAPPTGVPQPTPTSGTPSVSAVSPNAGPSCGATPVTITGTNFAGATAVTFGMEAATQPHSGSYSAQLQWASYSRDSGGDSYLYQAVAMPASGPAMLSFWYRDFCFDRGWDYLTVKVRDASGFTLQALAPPYTLCNHSETWTHLAYDLSAYDGQTIQVYFAVHGDGFHSPDTDFFFLDDVGIYSGSTNLGLVGNGGFESGDLSGWTLGTGPGSEWGNPPRGFLPRAASGFVIDSATQIHLLTPPQPAGPVYVNVLNPSVYEVNGSSVNTYTYGGMASGFDHYILRVEPNQPTAFPAPPGAASRAASINGILGPLEAGVDYTSALTLRAVDFNGNDIGAFTPPAGETITFAAALHGAPAPPTSGHCSSGPTIGGAAIGQPVPVTALPLHLEVTTCHADLATLTASTATGLRVDNANGSATAIQVLGVAGQPVGTFTASAPGTVAAGQSFNVTVSGLVDALGNPALFETAPHFTILNPTASAPSCYSYTSVADPTASIRNGAGSVTLASSVAGTQMSLHIGSASSTVPLTVNPAATTQYTFYPDFANLTAGTSALGTIYAADAYCNRTPAYTGTAAFSSSDPAFRHARATFTGGTFSDGMEKLFTAGTQAITVTDTTNSALTGTGTYYVHGAAPTGNFTFTAPTTTRDGVFSVSVSGAFDQYGNPANGSISLTPAGQPSSSPIANCTPDFTTSVPSSIPVYSGSGSVNVVLAAPGSYTLTASDGTSQAAGVTVTAGTVARFAFPNLKTSYATSPGTGVQVIQANSYASFEVDAVDSGCIRDTTYQGLVTIGSTDPRYNTVGQPSTTPVTHQYTLASGVFVDTYSANYLFSTGSWVMNATDGVHNGTSAALTVSGGLSGTYVAPPAPVRTAAASAPAAAAGPAQTPAPAHTPTPAPSAPAAPAPAATVTTATARP